MNFLFWYISHFTFHEQHWKCRLNWNKFSIFIFSDIIFIEWFRFWVFFLWFVRFIYFSFWFLFFFLIFAFWLNLNFRQLCLGVCIFILRKYLWENWQTLCGIITCWFLDLLKFIGCCYCEYFDFFFRIYSWILLFQIMS